MLAYLLLPPAGGVFLLVVEHKSDYVRCVKLGEGGFSGTHLLPVKLLWNIFLCSQVFAQPILYPNILCA